MTGPVIRAYQPADAPAVSELWTAAFPPRYRLRPEVLRATIDRNPHARPGDAVVAETDGRLVGFALAGIARSAESQLAERRGSAWLQAVVVAHDSRRRGLGTSLARTVAQVAPEAGASRLAAGGGLFYLWPGVPDDLPEARPFLESLGFAFDDGVTYDLRGDVGSLRIDEASLLALDRAGLTVAPARADDGPALLTFLDDEFGGSGGDWWHDTRWFLAEGGNPSDLLLLRDAAGAIGGFARIHTPASDPPGWPMFWHADAPGAGGLGPIGIAARLRGRGIGRALLVSALDRLRGLGSTDIVIDDTTLLGYYGPHGFSPWITYRHASGPVAPLLATAASRESG